MKNNNTIYELTIVYTPDAVEGTMASSLRAVLKGLGVEIVKMEWEGVKRLAYPVQSYDEGNYFYCELTGLDPNSVSGLNAYLEDNREVLRYLLVPQDVRR